VVALVLTACAGSDPQDSTAAVETAVVDCDSRVQVIPSGRSSGRIPESARRRSVVAGSVVFIGAKRWGDLPREARLPTRVKPPILVKAGPAVTITLSPESRSDAAFMVGRARKPFDIRGLSIELRPCPPEAMVANRRVGRRTPFLAGFKLRRPTCVRLDVEIDGDPEPITRQIPFLTACGSA
jgi:hypothetical protein